MLFKGNSEVDQIVKIFHGIGSPIEEEKVALGYHESWHPDFPEIQRPDLRDGHLDLDSDQGD